MALRPLFPFQQVQYVQIFPLKPVPLCTLFAGLGSTNKPATSLLLLSDSRSVLATLSFSPSFLLPETLWQIWQELSSFSSVLSGCNGFTDTRFSRGTTRLMSWRNRERYSCPLQSLLVSLLSLVSTFVFSRTGGALSHRNSSTRRFARFPPRNLCSLVTLAVFSLVYAATDTAYCLALISVGLAESRILSATPVDTCPRTSLISFCTVQLRTLCAIRGGKDGGNKEVGSAILRIGRS